MTIDFSPATERWLAAEAAKAGTTPEAVVRELVEQAAPPREKTLDEILAPFRKEFAESGMTEEEFDALIEEARNEVWEEWQRKKQ